MLTEIKTTTPSAADIRHDAEPVCCLVLRRIDGTDAEDFANPWTNLPGYNFDDELDDELAWLPHA